MTHQETDAVIVAVEDAVVTSLPDTISLPRRVEIVLQCRREVARVLRATEPEIRQ